jgi:hypothetical protein
MNWLQQHGLSTLAILALYLVVLELLHRAFRPRDPNTNVFPPILRIRLLTWLWLGFWGGAVRDFFSSRLQSRSPGDGVVWALLLLPLAAFLSWPGTVVVTQEGIEQFRIWRIWRRFVPWSQVVQVEYRWTDRTTQGWGILFFVDGFRTTVRSANGSAVVHSARNEDMLAFDKLLRQRLPDTAFSESRQA